MSPQLFVPLGGAFRQAAGSGFNLYGENLDRPAWQGAELGFLDTFPDVLAAVGEAEFHDWIIGVHHPLYKEGGPTWGRFLDRDPAVRRQALDIAASSAQAAHHIGARYILFHFPWPGFQSSGVEHRDQGWYFTHPLELDVQWPAEEVYKVSRSVFDRLAEVQEREHIQIVLEIDGPNRHYFEDDLYGRLFAEFPSLSLCVDTGRLGLLARTHGQDPLELCRRWLPWTRHIHLHTSTWDEAGKFRNHIPTVDGDRVERWPSVTPAADLAEMIVAAQPRCSLVLEHKPRAVSPDALEAAHAYAGKLAGVRP